MRGFISESLHNLKAAMLRRQEAEIELNDQLSTQNTPEMKAKVRECQEAEEQLVIVEQKLGIKHYGHCISISIYHTFSY